MLLREAAKKQANSFLMAVPLRGGGKGPAIVDKNYSFCIFWKEIVTI